MEKRLIAAVTLSILVILVYQYYVTKAYPPPPHKVLAEKRFIETPQPAVAPERKPENLQPETVKEDVYRVTIGKYELVFSNAGGSIKEIRLKEFKSQDGDSPLELVSIKNPRNYIFALENPSGQANLNTVMYTLSKNKDGISYTILIDDLEIEKQYLVNPSQYAIKLHLIVKNVGQEPKDFLCRVTGGSGIIERNQQDLRFIEVSSKVDGKVINFKRQKDNRVIQKGGISWVALKNKYFSLILKPLVGAQFVFDEETGGGLVTGIEVQKFTLPPRSFIVQEFMLYAGPADPHEMATVDPEFEESINYGIFGGISTLLLAIIKISYKIFHNWGIAIIALAIVLNALLFPLTNKSFKSMQKMQSLQPQMEKLKAEFKDNPQKLNKEMMELYKKNKINPLGGCLPLLLQMPVFIALYQALVRFIGFKNSGFLWIKDLSLPDALKIPFALPVIGNTVNILPILMAVGMVIQQKTSNAAMAGSMTDDQRQQQQMMMILMPIMFGFIFYKLPSGLVLYWFVNTLLTIGEQKFIFKRHRS